MLEKRLPSAAGLTGGLALGLDRVVATLEGQDSIRDFIAFPKNTSASSPMDQCPSEVEPVQLLETHISLNVAK